MKKHKNLFEIFFSLTFIIQVVLILINNLTMIEKNLDSDSARLLRHIILMAEGKKILIPDWAYPTTLEFDCTTLFALPLYMITGNIYLSASIANILILLLFAAVIFYLFDGKSPIYPLFSLNFILIPYTSGVLDYYNMLFYSGSQYIIKVMLPILLVGLILHFRTKNEKKVGKITYLLCIVFFFLVFLTSLSSGWYVAACGLFPVMAVYILFKFFKKESVNLNEILLLIITFSLSFVGEKINSKIAGALGNDMLLRTSYDLWDYWGRCFVGIFELTGGFTPEWTIRPFSSEGINILTKLGLTVLFLVSIPIAVQKFRKENSNPFFLLLVSIPIWNYFILCAIYAQYGAPTFEYRYHLIGVIPTICIFSALFAELISKTDRWQQVVLYSATALGIIYLTISCFKPLFAAHDNIQSLKTVITYCQELDENMIYFLNDNPSAEICRLLDTSGKKEYLGLYENGTTTSRDYYARYADKEMQKNNFAMIIDYDSIQWGETSNFNGMTLKQIMIIGNLGVYVKAE